MIRDRTPYEHAIMLRRRRNRCPSADIMLRTRTGDDTGGIAARTVVALGLDRNRVRPNLSRDDGVDLA